VLAISLLAFLCSSVYHPRGKTLYHSFGANPYPAGELLAGARLEQTIAWPADDRFSALGVQMATYARTNSAHLQITLLAQPGEQLLFEKTVNSAELIDNSWYTLALDPDLLRSVAQRDRLVLVITSLDGVAQQSPTVWLGTQAETAPGRQALAVNGVYAPGQAIRHRFHYEIPGATYRTVRMIAWLAVTLLACLAVWLFTDRPEQLFLVSAALVGTIMLLLNPFPHPLDEPAHFVKAYALSRGQLVAETRDGQVGYAVPGGVYDLLVDGLSLDDGLGLIAKQNPDLAVAKQFSASPGKYTAGILIFNYIPQAAGIWLGRILGLPAIWIVLLGRLANFGFYIWFIYLAIKRIPVGKSILLSCALLPMAVFISASFSTDPLLIAASFLFVAICLDYLYRPEDRLVTWPDLVLLFVAALLIISVKNLGYSVICLAFFLIPRTCFKKGWYWKTVVAASLLVLAVIVLYFYYNRFASPEDRNGAVSVGRQIASILADPLTFLKILVYDRFFHHLITMLVGYTSNVFSSTIAQMLPVGLVLIALLDRRPKPLPERLGRQSGIYLVFAALFVYGIVSLALYLGFTPVGARAFDGIQPRYFLPILPLVLLLVNRLPVEHQIRHLEKYAALASLLFLLNQYWYIINAA
jgi:uncharacterized membrane protein